MVGKRKPVQDFAKKITAGRLLLTGTLCAVMDILIKTLETMPNSFTSNEFCKCARKKGYPKNLVVNGFCLKFLLQHAVRASESKRMWTKMNQKIHTTNENEIQQAIALLKSNGYKVMKPISDWAEV